MRLPTLALAALVAATAVAPVDAAIRRASDYDLTDALIWVGASDRVARHRIDRRDRPAIIRAETRLGSYIDGRLDDAEADALIFEGDRVRGREGYRIVSDPATGARLGLPTAWTGQRLDWARGSVWRSPDGALTVETFRMAGTLEDVRRIERRLGVEIAYTAGHDRWTVVSGYMPGGRTSYTRAVARNGEVSGFRVTYETDLRYRLDRVAVAMSSDFEAFAAPGEGGSDALAYAPRGGVDGAFEAARPPAPRYAILPERGPEPRSRPVREVASLDPVAPPTRARERAIDRSVVERERVEREVPRREVIERERVPPAEPNAPVTLLDGTGESDLAPPRGLDPVQPDTGQQESAVPRSITGLVTEEGQSCPTLRAADGTLYALVGEVPSLSPGTLVTIEAVGVDDDVCSAGRPVAVGGLQVRSSP